MDLEVADNCWRERRNFGTLAEEAPGKEFAARWRSGSSLLAGFGKASVVVLPGSAAMAAGL